MREWVILILEGNPLKDKKGDKVFEMPSVEEVMQELGKATSIDAFRKKTLAKSSCGKLLFCKH